MSSIKSHPLYPFVRIGLAFDLYPDWANYPEGVVDNDWHIAAGSSSLTGATYNSESDALAAVDSALFEKWNSDLVEQQIQLARERNDWPLLRRLVEGGAWAGGYAQAERDIAKQLSPLSGTLQRFIHRTAVLR